MSDEIARASAVLHPSRDAAAPRLVDEGRRLSLIGALVVAGPASYAVVGATAQSLSVLTLLGAALISFGAVMLLFSRRVGALSALAGVGAELLSARHLLVASPPTALICGVGFMGLLFGLFALERAGRIPRVWGSGRAARAAVAISVSSWVVVAVSEAATEWRVLSAAGAALCVALLQVGGWAFRVRSRDRARAIAVGVVLSFAFSLGLLLYQRPLWALSAGALLALAIVPFVRDDQEAPPLLSEALEHPARLVVTTFIALCLCGSVFLAVPASSAEKHVGLLDAAFTAVSATCVTGLVVVDTGSAYSLLGQGIILLLIQIGGLGIMTFYTVALGVLGRRLSMRHEMAVAGAAAVEDRASLFRALGRVLLVTVMFEGLGAATLFWRFSAAGDWSGMASWRALFTSISAFCNAGFALQADSLVRYNLDPIVTNTVGLLIIAGGLSPAVLVALPALAQRRRVPLQYRLIVTMSIALLVAGFVSYLTFDWSHSLAALDLFHKLDNAWFQSLTLRTAGFNSVDIALAAPVTQAMMIAMMFVGGSPGGTAGGIKTTTAALLLLAVVAALRGRADATAFGRRVDHASVYKAAAVATVGVLAVLVAVMAILLTQNMPPNVALFEVVSALATVGLSLGGTALLDEVGKVIIMICMFVGRVGPLTLFLFLTEQRTRTPWMLPDERVDVG